MLETQSCILAPVGGGKAGGSRGDMGTCPFLQASKLPVVVVKLSKLIGLSRGQAALVLLW